MEKQLRNVNATIKKEAGGILCEKGLLEILKLFGTPHVTGSYELDLMTWKDIDIYLETDDVNEVEAFELGSRICASLHPVKMSFRNEIIGKTEGLPNGLYWGVHLRNESDETWKIDIWIVSPAECKKLLDYVSGIKNKLTPEAVNHILEIKLRCCQDPLYRRTFNSADIYSAVLDNDIKGYSEFMKFIHQKVFRHK